MVGGGPVGSALALLLEREGHQVLLVDAGRSREKVCGEGLLPAGWEVMVELGLDSALSKRAPIEHLTYRHYLGGKLQSMQAPLHQAAFGVERAELFDAFTGALERSQVELWRGGRFRSLAWSGRAPVATIEAPNGETKVVCPKMMVGADGLHSSVRRQAGLQSTEPRRYRRWGTRVYFRSPQRRGGVEVTLGEGLESYLTPLGGELHGLAFLWSPERLGRPLPGQGDQWERLLACFPDSFRETLPGREAFFGQNRALGPLQQRVTSVLHPGGRLALLGDASGYLDALTGEGLCLGLQQARILARLFGQGQLEKYPSLYWRLKARHTLVVNALLWLLQRPSLRDRVFQALHHSPRLFESVIGVAVGGESPLRLIHSGLFEFARGLMLPVPRAAPTADRPYA